MQILVLGGGGFLGFHVVAAAVAAGHDVTVFARHADAAPPGVQVRTGDRLTDVSSLRHGAWDVVVDTFTDDRPGAPAVADTVRLLSGRVAGYVYVSGMSVYAPSGPAVPDEDAPVRLAGVEPAEDPLQERSLAKLAAERATSAFDGAVLLARVGIMVGPRDPSHRFTWWPQRLARLRQAGGGRLVRPGDPERPVQYSDARDIAAWLVTAGGAGVHGVHNVVGPGRTESLADVLSACARAAGLTDDDVEWVDVPEATLRRALAGVTEEQRPLWFPEDQIPQRAVDSGRAIRAGLRFRPVEDTARDCLAEPVDQGLLDGAAQAVLDRMAAAGPA